MISLSTSEEIRMTQTLLICLKGIRFHFVSSIFPHSFFILCNNVIKKIFFFLHILNSQFKVYGDILGTGCIMDIFINKIARKCGRARAPVSFFNQQFIAHCFLEDNAACWVFVLLYHKMYR